MRLARRERSAAERLRREHSTLFRRLPDPFHIPTFCDVVSDVVGRPVSAHPFAKGTFTRFDACGVNGICVRADDEFIIGYAGYVPVFHQVVITLHEAAHIVCGHLQDIDPGAGLTGAIEIGTPLGNDSAPVRQVLGRSDFRGPQEQTAETLAILLADRVRQGALRSTDPRRVAALREFVGPLRNPFG
ncbi:hypothetical protein [Nonomuraea sp. NPDC023979]|uniref:hypothetical protein n=1 Tax=Nonomuraea sp. NPDC023979 TaxID=3154796 RepID=UPI0033F9311D